MALSPVSARVTFFRAALSLSVSAASFAMESRSTVSIGGVTPSSSSERRMMSSMSAISRAASLRMRSMKRG